MIEPSGTRPPAAGWSVKDLSDGAAANLRLTPQLFATY